MGFHPIHYLLQQANDTTTKNIVLGEEKKRHNSSFNEGLPLLDFHVGVFLASTHTNAIFFSQFRYLK
jgi:hypothetical protein